MHCSNLSCLCHATITACPEHWSVCPYAGIPCIAFLHGQGGLDLRKDRQALQRLTEAAEKAKIELSGVQQTAINLPFITATAEGPKHIDATLTRAKFEEMCSDLLERCRRPVEQALKDAKLSLGEVKEVILVGGSTRIPAVQDLVRKMTGKEPNVTVNPDEVVAMGAAVQVQSWGDWGRGGRLGLWAAFGGSVRARRGSRVPGSCAVGCACYTHTAQSTGAGVRGGAAGRALTHNTSALLALGECWRGAMVNAECLFPVYSPALPPTPSLGMRV